MKQIRVVEEKASVHSDTELASPLVAELHAGDEVGVRNVVNVSGVSWCAVTLSDGRVGYVPPPFKGVPMRRVALAQKSVDVLESPAPDSKRKMSYTTGDQFTVAGVVKEGETQWVEIRTGSGNVGFIPAGTQVKQIAESAAAGDLTPALSCPKCFKTAISRPLGWKTFQAGVVGYIVGLFAANKAIELQARPQFSPGDLVLNPFVQRVPQVYVPPDYSPVYVVAVVGLCVLAFFLYSALFGKNTCDICGHRWRS
jgi:hypothetical protein